MNVVRIKILFFFLFLFSSQSHGQNKFLRKIENGKFNQAEKKITKSLKKEPNDIASNYAMSRLLMERKFNGYNTSKSYEYLIKTEQLFGYTHDEKEIKNLNNIPLNSGVILNYLDTICQYALDDAVEINTVVSFEYYLSYFKKANTYYKNTAILKRDTAAFLICTNQNTLESFENFILNYPDALQISEAIAKRNYLAYEQAIATNTIASYKAFINKYPNAKEVKEAWEKIYNLAYQEAQVINSIESYELFIASYPLAKQVKLASEKIHELAFNVAKSENTSKAYQAFITKYPKSSQTTVAKDLFYTREFEENTSEGMWESYRDFYEKFDSPYKKNAIDSIVVISKKGNIHAFDFLIDKKIKIDSINIFAFEVFRNLSIRGELEELNNFYSDYIFLFDYEQQLKIISSISLANLCFELKLDEPFRLNKKDRYIQYIKLAGGTELSFVALQRLISLDIYEKKYENALKTIESLEQYFPENKNKVESLKALLRTKYDNNISPIPINEINTLGNEYSPIISADNKYILFCGKDRLDNLSGEDIYISKKLNGKFEKPLRIEELSKSNSNEAPVCISSDGSEILLFSNGKIFKSSKEKNGWSEIEIIEAINSDFWQGDASISSDNQTLIFARGSSKNNKEKEEEKDATVISIKSGMKKESFVNDYLLGDGITANNILLSNGEKSYGVFSGGLNAGLPIESGIMLSTGNVHNSAAFNSSEETSSTNYNNATENLRKLVPNNKMYDATELTFDFISVTDTMSFNYIFGSEEYPEYVCSEFNDVFGFFLSGPNPNGGYYKNENIAKLPNSNTFVSINTINNGFVGSNGANYNCDYIDPNWRDLSVYYNSNENNKFGWELDGFTDNLSTGAKLIPGAKYTISIAIADLTDDKYDSYVILEKNSFRGVTLISNANSFDNYHGDYLPLSDIYISHKNNFGEWQKPIRLPNSINSPYTERSPFLHPDMKTLYFSSDGNGGLGKLDVYMSKRLADSCWDCWSEPINLGKEINSPNSDWGYKISTDGQTAYFSKDSKSKSREDIYKITLPPNLRPDYVARVEGQLKNSDNNPISTSIHWEDLEGNKIIGTAKTDPKDGTYFIVLPLGKNYGYYIQDSSYFPISQNLDLRDSTMSVEIKKNLQVVTFEEMIEKGISVPMNNLFFEFAKYDLLNTSLPELNRIAKIIIRYNLKVEISGHTDNVGEDKSNQILSERRAKAVMDFLIRSGCDKKLLQTIGYGEYRPLDSNENESGRANNRRVEIKFIK